MERSRTSVLIQSELAWRMMLKIEQRLGNLSSKTNAKFSGRQREWPGRQIWRCLKRPIDLRCSRRYDQRNRADYRESPCFLLQVLQIFVVILGGCLWPPPPTLICMGRLIMFDPFCFAGNSSHHSRTKSFLARERQFARQGRRLHPASARVSGAAQYFNQEMIANFIVSTHRHARRTAKLNKRPWVLL